MSCVVVHVYSSLSSFQSHKVCFEIFCSLQHPFEKQKKRKEKAEGAQKKEKKSRAKKKKEQEKIESEKSEEKFRSACILLRLCAELFYCLLELGPG